MSHTDPSSSTRPSPFLRVPTEIKALIAAQAVQQDQVYKERIAAAPSWGLVADVDKRGARPGHGRSINALFCVSREWNALAAPHVFKTVSSKRCGESLFMMRIANRHSSFVEEAVFVDDNADEDGPRLLLTLLPLFVNLRRVSVHHNAFLHLLGVAEDHRRAPTAAQVIHRAALLDRINQGLQLALLRVDLPQLSWILPRIGGVKHLDVLGHPQIYDEDGTKVLATAQILSRVSNLEHLSLRGLDEDTVNLLTPPGTAWVFAPTLRSIEVGVEVEISTAVWTFIASFSATLEKLVLATGGTKMSAKLSKRAEGNRRQNFAFLRYVALDGTLKAVTQLLSLLSASPLRIASLSLSDWSHEALLPLLRHLVEMFPRSIHQVELTLSCGYPTYAGLPLPALADLTSFASRHHISLIVDPLDDTFYDTPDRKVPSSLSATCAAADDTLRFGLVHSARLLETEDFEGARALLDLLVPLKGEMLRLKD